jgi:hypothetical protein
MDNAFRLCPVCNLSQLGDWLVFRPDTALRCSAPHGRKMCLSPLAEGDSPIFAAIMASFQGSSSFLAAKNWNSPL